MSDRPDLPPNEIRDGDAPPFETLSNCWYRFAALTPSYQRFIIPDLGRYLSASCVIDREVYVAMELLHLHTAEDTDWSRDPAVFASDADRNKAKISARRSRSDLYNWWPLLTLEAGFIRFMFVEIAQDPTKCSVIDGTLYIDRNLVASYVVGDDDWLYEDDRSWMPVSTQEL